MKTLSNFTFIMFILAILLMAGCKKTPEGTEIEGHNNPNPAQDTPLSEHFLSEFQSIYQLYLNPDGSFYALAGGETTDYLVKLDNSGYVQQRVELGFRSRRCLLKTDENIVVIGNEEYSNTPYEMFGKGLVSVFDRNMQLIAMTYVSEPQYKIELNTIIQDSRDSNQFIVGGIAIDDGNLQYPYLCGLEFSNGTLRKMGSKTLSEYAKYRIVGMVEKNYAGQTDYILETVHYTVLDYPYHENSCAVHIIKPNIFEEESGWGSETWDVAITGLHGNSYTGNNSIDSDNNNVYFFGCCNDDKSPAPSSGYWHSGCVAAVNWHQGQMVWTKVFSLTNKSDHFYDGQLIGDCLYAWGMHGGLMFNNTQKRFGNGLISKISLSGDLIAYQTFGDPERSSFLIHLVQDSSGNIVCVGESGENLDEGELKYSGWFLKTDLSSKSTSKIASTTKLGDDEIVQDVDAGRTFTPTFSRMNYDGI